MLTWSRMCKLNMPRAALQSNQPPLALSNTSKTDISGGTSALGSPQARGSGGDAVAQTRAVPGAVLTT